MLESAPIGASLPKLENVCAVQLQEYLPVTIRRLCLDDIDQVVAIEKEAFSPLWVSTAFKRDINNKRANYLVACFEEASSAEEILAELGSDDHSQDDLSPQPNLWTRVLGRLGISSDNPVSYTHLTLPTSDLV